MFQEQTNQLIALYSSGEVREALRGAEQLVARYRQVPWLYNFIGACQAKLGFFDMAVNYYKRCLDLKPDYIDAYNNMGNALTSLGKFSEAALSFRKAIKIKPDYAAALNHLGVVYQKQGQLEDAISCYEKALSAAPAYASAYNNLGVSLKALDRFEEAIAAFTKAIECQPNYSEFYYNMALCQREVGTPVRAEISLRSALQCNDKHPEAYNCLGKIQMEEGELDEATNSFRCAIECKSDYAEAYRNLSMVHKFDQSDPLLDQMAALFVEPNLTDMSKMHLGFSLSKAYADIGAIDQSFEVLKEANTIRKKELGYTIEADLALVDAIKTAFSKDVSISPDEKQKSGRQPIFIVGMPRSGTSLCEHILASHSSVFGAGELEAATDAANAFVRLQEADGAWKLNEQAIAAYRDAYKTSLDQVRCSENVVTDKMPQNFLWLGFILSAFPKAKVIHLKRDPRATCWSIYKNYFSANGSGYAYDMEDLAKFYHIYEDLMVFWAKKFPDQIFDLHYEQLTQKQEEETRKLLAFCNLEWEDSCLNFHKTSRTVVTASAAQVRQKMYQGSSDAWHAYEAHLAPLLKALNI